MAPPYGLPVNPNNPNNSFWTPGYQEEFEKKRRNYVSGYGMPSTTEQSINALAGGNSPGTTGFMNNLALWPERQDFRRRFPAGPESSTFDPSTLGGADHPMHQGMFSKGVDALGGWGALANLGLKGYGLYQQGQQIDDLRDWRAKLNERANASLAMDREKFDLVKQEYDTRSKKRQADMWSQRLDPASGGTANPYMSNLIQDA